MIAYLDCSTGVSGDKFLGALLDAGRGDNAFTTDDIAALLAKLAPEARVNVACVKSHGVSAVSLSVSAAGASPSRTWRSIRELLASADLSDGIRRRVMGVFERLAAAEATVHGSSLDDVHFHEVGAIDSLLDVVGVCAGLDALGVDRLVASPVATGWGTVDTSHGVLGIPAPATALLLVGAPVVSGPPRPDGAAPGELTTPTGAALLAGLGAEFGACPPMTADRVGFGAGTRDIGSPNVCRVMLGTPATRRIELTESSVTLLETNVDHISPEQAAFAAEQLLAEGAHDVWLAPIVMKKGRAATLLSVLVAPTTAETTAQRIVALTGTLGVRRLDIERYESPREVREVSTAWGTARVKVGAEGATHRVRPEHEDVARIAREHSLPYAAVLGEIARVAETVLGECESVD